MDGIVRAVEQAAHQLQHHATQRAAERALQEQLYQCPSPLAVCQHVLQHSTMLEARFYAARALRESVVRKWALYSPEDLAHLKRYLLQYVMQHAAEAGMKMVTTMISATLAVMLKRSWGDWSPEARSAFFQASPCHRRHTKGGVLSRPSRPHLLLVISHQCLLGALLLMDGTETMRMRLYCSPKIAAYWGHVLRIAWSGPRHR